MFASSFSDMCPQTICWQPMTGRDSYGNPSYGAAQTFGGRRAYKVERVPGGAASQGAVVLSSSTIWILGTPAIKYEDRVYVQGDAIFPPVINVQMYPDEAGDAYVKVQLGSAGQ